MPNRTDEFILELAKMPTTVDNILRDHVADKYGRCRGCALDPRMREPWPCGPLGIAREADKVLQRRDARVRLAG